MTFLKRLTVGEDQLLQVNERRLNSDGSDEGKPVSDDEQAEIIMNFIQYRVVLQRAGAGLINCKVIQVNQVDAVTQTAQRREGTPREKLVDHSLGERECLVVFSSIHFPTLLKSYLPPYPKTQAYITQHTTTDHANRWNDP